MHQGVKYRADIDGLRALAVLPVMFFHFGLNTFSGGYVGVDVFFVISGYLITQVIHADMTAGTYSIAKFYERRARRILPAYVFMALCVTICLAAFGFPNEIHTFSESLAAATLFVSNIYFYLSSGYFDPGSDTQPLLHTWSLAVEEQFYIFFPIVLWLINRGTTRRIATIVLVLAAVSLAVSAYLVQVDQSAAFYLIHSRAWELLLGSFIAIGIPNAPQRGAVREVMGAAGLALILASIFLFTDETPFPGLAALAPCLGTALLLQSGGETGAGRVLAFAPFRWIGLISYSLYLWHWPVWVFASNELVLEQTRLMKVGLVCLSIALATGSWWFVERPFRTKPFKLGTRSLLLTSAAALGGMLVVAAAAGPASRTFRGDYSSVDRILAVLDAPRKMREGQCFLTSTTEGGSESFDKSTCLQLSADKKNILIIGDSHAAHLWAGLVAANPEINFLQANASGCKPILGAAGRERCTSLRQFIFQEFLPAHKLDGIIMSANWTSADVAGAVSTALDLRESGVRAVIFGPTVEYRVDLPKLVALSIVRNDPALVDRNRRKDQAATDQSFRDQTSKAGVPYFSVYGTLCPDGHCRTVDDAGLPLAFDYGHLTESGSVLVGQSAHASGILTGHPTAENAP